MELIIKDFVNHLFDIGIVGIKTIKDFLNLYDKHKATLGYTPKDILFIILREYIKNLDENSLSKLCQDVIIKFAESKSLEKIKAAKVFINNFSKIRRRQFCEKFRSWGNKAKVVIQRDFILKQSESSKHSLNQQQTYQSNQGMKNANSTSSLTLTEQTNHPKYSQGSVGKIRKTTQANSNRLKISKNTTNVSGTFQKNDDLNLNSSNIQTMTTTEKIEERNMEQCTFKPKINNYDLGMRPTNSSDIYNRLYADHGRSLENKAMKKMAREAHEIESKKNSFIPVTTSSNIIKMGSFFERQAEYDKNSKAKKDIILKTVENEVQSNCTFSPKTQVRNRSKSSRNIHNNNGNQFVKYYVDNLKKVRERNFSKDSTMLNKSYDYNKSISKEKLNRSVDMNKIESLYSDYKKQVIKRKDLTVSINKEQGVTFKPLLSPNAKYRIHTTFKERNDQLLDTRKKSYEEYQFNLTNSSEFEPKKKYSQQELSEIKSGVIDRLYVKEIDKVLERNRNSKNQYKGKNSNDQANVKSYNAYLMGSNQGRSHQNELSTNQVNSTEEKVNVSNIEDY